MLAFPRPASWSPPSTRKSEVASTAPHVIRRLSMALNCGLVLVDTRRAICYWVLAASWITSHLRQPGSSFTVVAGISNCILDELW